jgi:uncharacterized membrane protein
MDLIIIVVAILALVGLIVVMFRYAGFIHQGPSADKQDKKQREDEIDNPSNKDNE